MTTNLSINTDIHFDIKVKCSCCGEELPIQYAKSNSQNAEVEVIVNINRHKCDIV